MSGEVQAILARFVLGGRGLPRFQEESLLRSGLTADGAQAALETWEKEVQRGIPDPLWRAGQLLEEALPRGHEKAPPEPPSPSTEPPSPEAAPSPAKVERRKKTQPTTPRTALLQHQEKVPAPQVEPAGGWIKLYRKALESPALQGDAKGMGLWVHVLLRAAYRTKREFGELLEPGQLLASYRDLCQWSGLSFQEVRTRFEKWQGAGMISTKRATSRGRVLRVINWHLYQGAGEDDQQGEQQTTSKKATKEQQGRPCKYLIGKGMEAPKKLRSKEERKEHAPSAPNPLSQENDYDPEQVRRTLSRLKDKTNRNKGQTDLPERDRRRVLEVARYEIGPTRYPAGPPRVLSDALEELAQVLGLGGEA